MDKAAREEPMQFCKNIVLLLTSQVNVKTIIKKKRLGMASCSGEPT